MTRVSLASGSYQGCLQDFINPIKHQRHKKKKMKFYELQKDDLMQNHIITTVN